MSRAKYYDHWDIKKCAACGNDTLIMPSTRIRSDGRVLCGPCERLKPGTILVTGPKHPQ